MTIRQAFGRFWPLTRGDRRWYVLVCCCVIVAAVCETVAILLFGNLTDHALQQGSLRAFWHPASAWLAVAVVGAIIGYLGNSLAFWSGERFVRRLRAHVFGHVQELPPDFFQRYRRGDLVERLSGDVEAIEQLVVSSTIGVLSAVFRVVLFAAAAFWLRWDLALVTFVLAPLLWLAAKVFSGPIRRFARSERIADGAITSVLEESLGTIELTQAYNRSPAEEQRLDREAVAWMRASVSGARRSELYEQVVEVLETLCVLGVIGLGVWEISHGRMTLGALLSFTAFLGYLYPPLRSLGELNLTATAATAATERLDELLSAEPTVTDPEHPVELATVHGRVEFDRVGFRYRDVDVLEDFGLTVEPGEFVVLTGPSGIGKSTIAKLLLRFHDPTAGEIRLDGVPLTSLQVRRLRESITLLPQQTHVLAGTIRANITYGRPGATPAEILAAARSANAHDFITALPEGYDTPLTPSSPTLSGGQLKRLTLARALLRNTPILVLDEPTTGLDAPTAHQLIQSLPPNRTTILITHDHSLTQYADRVVDLSGTTYGSDAPRAAGRLLSAAREL
ncbi:ATP-binding cassette subfamily B protein [Kribbella aluminosa]|uniref:ATP-binding cassette subfamily B protein n=1 Tax=Kribbella aluminosa TaxID=416017 RepID=A0ABS4URB3_9ACTN|nr:ABC transporter ATP-binding protein [Kribbella aluminosa]MBP2354160.1 ATP-binding cassette subfamily B protein [Kribbella aluminosa]